MDLACYPKNVVDIYESLIRESETQKVGSQPTTTTEFEPSPCEHCGRLFREGDSITLRGDGSIKSCEHWNL